MWLAIFIAWGLLLSTLIRCAGPPCHLRDRLSRCVVQIRVESSRLGFGHSGAVGAERAEDLAILHAEADVVDSSRLAEVAHQSPGFDGAAHNYCREKVQLLLPFFNSPKSPPLVTRDVISSSFM